MTGTTSSWDGVLPLSAEQQDKWAAACERIAEGREKHTAPAAGPRPRADILIRPEGAYRLVDYRGKDCLQHAPISIEGKIVEDEWVDVAWDSIDDEQKKQAAYAMQQLGGQP